VYIIHKIENNEMMVVVSVTKCQMGDFGLNQTKKAKRITYYGAYGL
jgi:hypothetical protein